LRCKNASSGDLRIALSSPAIAADSTAGLFTRDRPTVDSYQIAFTTSSWVKAVHCQLRWRPRLLGQSKFASREVLDSYYRFE
jgi:hypothetical protein